MKYEQLVESASRIYSPDPSLIKEYSEKLAMILEKQNKRMLNRKDILDLVGEQNLDLMLDNHANHCRFIQSVIENLNPEILVDTILWVFRAYQSRGFKQTYWAAQLNGWLVVLEEELTPSSFIKIRFIYQWMQINIPHFSILSEAQLKDYLPDHHKL